MIITRNVRSQIAHSANAVYNEVNEARAWERTFRVWTYNCIPVSAKKLERMGFMHGLHAMIETLPGAPYVPAFLRLITREVQ